MPESAIQEKEEPEMKVFALIADGTEEVECLTVVDILRRAGMDVTLVSVMAGREVVTSHGIRITADRQIDEVNADEPELLFLPGGGLGTQNLKDSPAVTDLVRRHAAAGKLTAAICAAPSVLGVLGLLKGKRATCYPGFEEQLEGAVCVHDGVVADGSMITARGMGKSVDLGLKLVEIIQGREAADKMAGVIQYTD